MERRRHSRAAVGRRISGRVPASPIAATVLDLSLSGCRGRADPTPRRGSTILLELAPGSEVSGEVLWSNGDEFGVRFHQEIADELVARLSGGAQATTRDEGALFDQFGRRLPPLPVEIRIKPLGKL